MKLDVSGIETIEITDPKGLCNPPVPQVGISGPPWQPGQPVIPTPQPMIPTPFTPPFPRPYTGDPVPNYPSIWTKDIGHTAVPKVDPDYKEKWGLGISEANRAEPKKWAENWKSKVQEPFTDNEPPPGYESL